MVREIDEIVFDKINAEQLSDEEQLAFEQWYNSDLDNRESYDRQIELRAALKAVLVVNNLDKSKAWKQITGGELFVSRRFPKFLFRYAAAIAIMLCAGVATYKLITNDTISQDNITVITPGRNQAMLTLSSGVSIPLDDKINAINGELTDNVKLNEQGVLIYDSTAKVSQRPLYNTLSVPRGGEYQLILSDGTKVWLNSESKITYPTTFPDARRTVSVTGEVYFEVAHNKAKPFVVTTEMFSIRVTGTKFNVRAYAAETPSATLLEGGVTVEHGDKQFKLIPGQQSRFTKKGVEISNVNIDEVIAWRNQAFCFKHRTLESILAELARWYDLDVRYDDTEVRNYYFSAWFSRNESIEEVINILSYTNKIEILLTGKVLNVKKKL